MSRIITSFFYEGPSALFVKHLMFPAQWISSGNRGSIAQSSIFSASSSCAMLSLVADLVMRK